MEMLTDYWWLNLLAGFAGSGLIALAAYASRSLSGSGAWSAAMMGTAFVALGGPVWFGTLIAFFLTSTLWSKYKRRHRSKAEAESKYAKTGRRDAGQVWANGGLGLALCAGHAVWPDPGWLHAFVGVMAAVTADTWATELGALSRTPPRSIVGGRPVAPGTSGGVTALGSAAALAGAVFIGAAAALLAALPPREAAALAAVAAAAGLAGAFADSLLGATGQAMYRCRACGSETERAAHCGVAAERFRGFAFLDNDRVNLLSSAAAGALAWALGALLI
ncbi:membrane protein [Paenibacillus sp. 32O-W]|nr:membrane protein [Paenibacillus sp. 32O-W]